MKKYVRVRKSALLVMIVLSLVISILITFILYSGYKVLSNLETEVYANEESSLDLESVVVTEERIIPIFREVEVEIVEQPLTMRKIGDFNLTAYCPCSICCDQWGASPEGKTVAIGVGAYAGISFAVDPTVIPYGTKLYIEGVGVGIATDCGGAIKGNRIDVYYSDHDEALEFGRGGGYAHGVYVIE